MKEKNYITSFMGDGVSLDGAKDLKWLPGFVGEVIGEDKRKFNGQYVSKNTLSSLYTNDTSSINLAEYSDQFIPDSQTSIMVVYDQDKNVRDYQVTMTPKLVSVEESIPSSYLFGHEKETSLADLTALIEFSKYHISKELFTITNEEKAVLQIHKDLWIIDESLYEQNYLTGEPVYNLSYDNSFNDYPEFSYIASRCDINTTIYDSNRLDKIDQNLTQSCLVVAGVVFGRFSYSEVQKEVDVLIKSGNATDEAFRNLIYPYIYLKPIIQN